MARVLVTGMSGAESTLLVEMVRRGYEAIDTDCDGWTLPDGTWDEPRMAALLVQRAVVVVSGMVENQRPKCGPDPRSQKSCLKSGLR